MASKKHISNAVARVVSNQQTSLDEDTSQTLSFLKNFVTLPVVLQWVAQWLTPGPSSQTTGSQGNESTSNTNCYQETEVQELPFALPPQETKPNQKTPTKTKKTQTKGRYDCYKDELNQSRETTEGELAVAAVRFCSSCPLLLGVLLEQL